MSENKYRYLEGIADWCKDANAPISIAVDYRRETHCEYCGAEIMWRFTITDSSPEPRVIMVGSECVKKFEQYMATEKRKIHDMLRYFEKYQALARKAKIFPESKIELRQMETEMKKLQAVQEEAERKAKVEKHRDPIQREPMEALRKLVDAGAKEFMGNWEKGFVDSVLEQYFSYLHLMSFKQLEIVKKLVDQYSKMDFAQVEQMKAEKEKLRRQLIDDMELIQQAELFTGNRRRWVQGLEHPESFLDSVRRWVQDGKPLTEKQKAAVQNTIKREEERREKARQIQKERVEKRSAEMAKLAPELDAVVKRLGLSVDSYSSESGMFRIVRYPNINAEIDVPSARLLIEYVMNTGAIREQNLSKKERAGRAMYTLYKGSDWMMNVSGLPEEAFAE